MRGFAGHPRQKQGWQLATCIQFYKQARPSCLLELAARQQHTVINHPLNLDFGNTIGASCFWPASDFPIIRRTCWVDTLVVAKGVCSLTNVDAGRRASL